MSKNPSKDKAELGASTDPGTLVQIKKNDLIKVKTPVLSYSILFISNFSTSPFNLIHQLRLHKSSSLRCKQSHTSSYFSELLIHSTCFPNTRPKTSYLLLTLNVQSLVFAGTFLVVGVVVIIIYI